MKQYKQLYAHNPPYTYGDCYRTAIGCLLDVPPEEVPHFYGIYPDDVDKAHELRDDWLRSRGYRVANFVYECSVKRALWAMGQNNPGLLYMMSGQSGSNPDISHVVVCRGGDVIWDPSPDETGIVGPNKDGQIIIELLMPARMSG
jgi:hypothetical protein